MVNFRYFVKYFRIRGIKNYLTFVHLLDHWKYINMGEGARAEQEGRRLSKNYCSQLGWFGWQNYTLLDQKGIVLDIFINC